MSTTAAPYGWTSTDLPKRHRHPARARFWQWHNCSFVRVSIRDGQRLRSRSCRRTDEGYSIDETIWHREGAQVFAHHWNESIDCDGRHSSGAESVCHVDDLKAREAFPQDGEGRGLHVPEWMPVDSWHRDHTAEAAGY